jgi:glycosyltransferase involved in cell wall biosynthesis
MIIFEPHDPSNLVSVIITCFNQGRFLRESIASVLRQSYPRVELIVIDDGSWDNTREVALQFQTVKYIHQPNSGLAAARNRGVAESHGKFLVFLDADDWLYPQAIETNLGYFQSSGTYAFVSGWHDKVDEWNYPLENENTITLTADHYLHLLQGNYIGMHAAVMYQRWVFSHFKFDTSLDACEDYDLYFKITREYPVCHHGERVAAYRIHGHSMSARIPFMLANVLKVCKRQRPLLRTDEERQALDRGIKTWKKYYSRKTYLALLRNMAAGQEGAAARELILLCKYYPSGLFRYILKKTKHAFVSKLKRNLPDPVLKSLFAAGLYKRYTPKPGSVNGGDFQRIAPFSYDFGFERGGPVDRFYIENFLDANKKYISGRVLEIGDNAYTLRFGENKVIQSDILHVDHTNSKATYIGDITHVPQIPSGCFDCIIFTQTLHLIYDFKSALQTCFRILKPGGCLLLTVPGISQVDYGEWKDYWLWSFTTNSIRRMLLETFHERHLEVQCYGNVYVAAAFLYGMGLPEVKKDFLYYHDPGYQVIISAKAIKS